MLLKNEELIGLSVFTQSGQKLGRVSGFQLDSETHLIFKYFVKSSHIVEGLFKGELLIDKNQVISLNKEKMVVEDLVLKENIEGLQPVVSGQ